MGSDAFAMSSPHQQFDRFGIDLCVKLLDSGIMIMQIDYLCAFYYHNSVIIGPFSCQWQSLAINLIDRKVDYHVMALQ